MATALDSLRIVLVETSHPGNIGGAARAMKTMGLSQLWLVRPARFPDPQAEWRAAGALDVLDRAIVVDSLDQAIGDCSLVVGTSTRSRRIPWPIATANTFAQQFASEPARAVALLFGRETSGLTNDELQRCHLHLQIPANPAYSSLNVAMAVQVVCYELFQAQLGRDDAGHDTAKDHWDREPATVAGGRESARAPRERTDACDVHRSRQSGTGHDAAAAHAAAHPAGRHGGFDAARRADRDRALAEPLRARGGYWTKIVGYCILPGLHAHAVPFAMRLTTKGRYAVTAMLDLALHGATGPVALAEISARQGISQAYLEQLFGKLKRARLVHSLRGPGGGYALSRAPASISISQIISTVGEGIDATRCGGSGDCQDGLVCITHDLWMDLSQRIDGFLSAITLASLLERDEVQAIARRQDALADRERGERHGPDPRRIDARVLN